MKVTIIKQLETYARYHPEVVSLSQGIPFMNSAASIREYVVASLLQNRVDEYADPQGVLALRQKISEELQREQMNYHEDEIIVTAGATEALAATLLSFLSPEKNEVIIPTPTYSAWFRSIEIAHGKPNFIPLDEENQWSLDISILEKNITKYTAAIFLCNPNNPTGSIYSKEVLAKVCTLAQQHNIMVIIDEVYKQMIFDNASFYTPTVNPSLKKNLIRIVSFSKDFSLTGWRVGFLHSDSSVIQKILPVHDGLVNCAPVISQFAAIAALENQEQILSKNKEIYSQNRALMKGYLDGLKDYLQYQIPHGSYFFFPRFLQKQNSELFCMDLLKNGNIAVVPGSDFGPGGENHIRLCFGRDEASIMKGMEGLTTYLTNNYNEK